MKNTLIVCFALLAAFVFVMPARSTGAENDKPGQIEWVVKSLKEMQTIHAGMTRKVLLQVFTVEGGLSTRMSRKYVYRGCSYMKVDVEFEKSATQKKMPEEAPEDKIIKISKPYLEESVVD